MKLEQFIEDIKVIAEETGQLREMGLTESRWGGKHWEDCNSWRTSSSTKYERKKFVLESEWSTGGMTGGSCWEDSNPVGYSSNNPPEELVILDAILEKFNPNVTFIQYKALTNKLITHDSRTESEYYGNSTNYSSYVVDVEELFHYMTEKGWLS